MIIDHIRNIEEFRKLFLERPMNDGLYSFEFIINNPHLYCFYGEQDDKLKGFIFITRDSEGKLYLSGASVPKNMTDNIDAIIKICDSYNHDMYSETEFKPAELVLRKAGFVKLKTNLYVRRKYG